MGCNPSIEVLCEDIAEIQCNKCESCASDESAKAASFCEIKEGEDCISELVSRCNASSAGLPEPKTSLEKCEEELSSMMCSTLYLSETQGHLNTTPTCEPFL